MLEKYDRKIIVGLIKDAGIWAKRKNPGRAIIVLQNALQILSGHSADLKIKIESRIDSLEGWLDRLILLDEMREGEETGCSECGEEIKGSEKVHFGGENYNGNNILCEQCAETSGCDCHVECFLCGDGR